MILDVVRWLVFGALLLVLLPYTLIAAWGLVVGVLRQLPARSSTPQGEPKP